MLWKSWKLKKIPEPEGENPIINCRIFSVPKKNVKLLVSKY